MSQPADDREGFAAFLMRMRAAGITDQRLAAAIEAIPRRGFVAGQWLPALWADRSMPIECGEVIEGVDLQARIVNALAIEDHHRVLEIGTGSGYTAALMSKLAQRVHTLERYKSLVEQARKRFEALGLGNIALRHADAARGMAADGPFDRIVSWVSFDTMPRNFVEQLASGGIMVAAIGPGDGRQFLARLTKVGSRFEREDIGEVRFQPMLGGLAAVL